MKPMLILLVMVFSFVVSAHANIHRVAKDGCGDFITVQAAIDASAAGDTVIVMGDRGPYSESPTISQPIILIGQGTNICGQVPVTEIVGRLTLAAGSDSSTIEGFYITTSTSIVPLSIQANVTGITIMRCRLMTNTFGIPAVSTGDGVSAGIYQCSLDGQNYAVNIHTNNSITISNSIIANSSSGVAGENLNTSIIVRNCVFVGCGAPFVDVAMWNVENCIFWDCNQINGFELGNFMAAYNAFNVVPTNFPYVAGQDTVISAVPFVGYDNSLNWVCSSDLNLPAGSPLRDRGDPNAANDSDGTRRDLGIYGGPYPFIDTGAPDFPFVTQLFVPATVPQNGVLEIRSTGRVGQGN